MWQFSFGFLENLLVLFTQVVKHVDHLQSALHVAPDSKTLHTDQMHPLLVWKAARATKPRDLFDPCSGLCRFAQIASCVAVQIGKSMMIDQHFHFWDWRTEKFPYHILIEPAVPGNFDIVHTIQSIKPVDERPSQQIGICTSPRATGQTGEAK